MFVADFLYVNYVFENGNLLSIMLTKDKYLTSHLTFSHFLTLNYEHRQETGFTTKQETKTKKIRIMKKIFFAAVAAMFFAVNANAQSVNENEATVADVVAQLNQADALQFIPMYQQMLTEIEGVCRADYNDSKKTAKIEDIKEVYTDMFSQILVSEQNEVAMNSVSMEYFNNRIAK